MTSRMTVGRKLLLSFGALLLLMLGVSYLALSSISDLADANGKLVVTAGKRNLSNNIRTQLNGVLAAERGILVRGFMKDKAAMEGYHEDFSASAEQAKKAMDAFAALADTPEERDATGQMASALESIIQGDGELWVEARAGKADSAARVYAAKANPAILLANKIGESFTAGQTVRMVAAAKAVQNLAARVRWILLAMIALSLLVAVVVVFVVRRIDGELRRAVTDLAEGAGQVSSAAGQVSSSSQALAQGASEQAASLEETSASSEEINAMARQNAANSQTAANLVMQSQQKFAETNQSLDQMIVAMSEISTHSDKISKIIKVIDEIAFQTNILALNAAVEAARAGEAGMGFAVVADEVRNLAQRCARAAEDTASLIEESIVKSHDGKAKVDQVATAIRAITQESAQVKMLVDEVSLGSQEQTRGIEEIAKTLTQIEQVTQQSAANSEEGAAVAEELTSQAAVLMEVIERLGAMVGGGDEPRGKPPAARAPTHT